RAAPARLSPSLLLSRPSFRLLPCRRALLLCGRTPRRRHTLRKLRVTGLAIPFLERLRRDLSLHEQLRELAALCFALERHRVTSPGALPQGYCRRHRSATGPSPHISRLPLDRQAVRVARGSEVAESISGSG